MSRGRRLGSTTLVIGTRAVGKGEYSTECKLRIVMAEDSRQTRRPMMKVGNVDLRKKNGVKMDNDNQDRNVSLAADRRMTMVEAKAGEVKRRCS